MARRLSDHLVQIAELVLRQVAVGHVYAEGGATAAELVRRMGWARLSALCEPAPGVATLAIEGNESQLLTVKPGTYAWPEEWTSEARQSDKISSMAKLHGSSDNLTFR